MFISELINGKFYFIAEGPMRLARWSIVPLKPEPIMPIDKTQVPLRIRARAQEMSDADSKRRYNEYYRSRPTSTLRRAAAGDIRVPVPVDSSAGSSQLHRSPVADCDATV